MGTRALNGSKSKPFEHRLLGNLGGSLLYVVLQFSCNPGLFPSQDFINKILSVSIALLAFPPFPRMLR